MPNKKKIPKIALYRILGNDLPPRHKIGQTYANLKFILAYEEDFAHCHKRWIVNRVVDSKAEEKIIKLLEKYRQVYVRIPFDLRQYRALRIGKREGDARGPREAIAARYEKILYVMNNNAARNVAIRDGKKIADWIMPFDGNCFFTEPGWRGVIDKLLAQKNYDKYFVVPMYRLKENSRCFDFNPQGYPEHEPQLVLGRKTKALFNKSFIYGKDSKIEMLRRLGFKFEIRGSGYIVVAAGRRCGYVLRLFSGNRRGEESFLGRIVLRETAIDRMLEKLDRHKMSL